MEAPFGKSICDRLHRRWAWPQHGAGAGDGPEKRTALGKKGRDGVGVYGGGRRSGPSQLLSLLEILEDGSHSVGTVGHWMNVKGRPGALACVSESWPCTQCDMARRGGGKEEESARRPWPEEESGRSGGLWASAWRMSSKGSHGEEGWYECKKDFTDLLSEWTGEVDWRKGQGDCEVSNLMLWCMKTCIREQSYTQPK